MLIKLFQLLNSFNSVTVKGYFNHCSKNNWPNVKAANNSRSSDVLAGEILVWSVTLTRHFRSKLNFYCNYHTLMTLVAKHSSVISLNTHWQSKNNNLLSKSKSELNFWFLWSHISEKLLKTPHLWTSWNETRLRFNILIYFISSCSFDYKIHSE